MLEAMLFTVKEINNRTDILPNITLGVIAYDTCDSPVYALQQSLDFIKGNNDLATIDWCLVLKCPRSFRKKHM